jgi:alanine-glyoxylate transaminase/serine-glyoxylate transaminase/serine-pyruvate transaminase
MKAYENNSAAYFATPPVNLIYAFHASLTQIMQGSVSLEQRFKLHQEVSRRIKKAAEEVGFKGVPLSEDVQANGMSAVRTVFDCFTTETLTPRTALLPRWFHSERYRSSSVEERRRCRRRTSC